MSLHLNDTYQKADPSLWQGRYESTPNQRIYQKIQCIDLKKDSLKKQDKGLVIIGFISDEGVIRNFGRPGASKGPNALRTQLSNLPNFSSKPLYDVGNICCINHDLEGAQMALGHLINSCHEQGHKTLVLGGGHETAWGHYLGLKNNYPALGVINFDAHFDLRESDQSTSGTPFLQIANDKEKLKQPFNYFCYGIQKTANTLALFEKAKSLNVEYLKAEDIFDGQLNWQKTYIEDFMNKNNHIYVSFCMDVLNAAVAPGVSAPQTLGLMPWHVLPIIKFILKSEKVISFDIVELSPPLDIENKTARLASQLAAEVLYT